MHFAPVWNEDLGTLSEGKTLECFLITVVEGRPAVQLARRGRFPVHSALGPADRHVAVVRVKPRTTQGELGPSTEAA